jgi:hypothetical protein
MISPNRIHDRTSFFKYMSAATALKVLKNCSLRWSSPILFNDPFDVPRELSFGLTPNELVEASGRRMRSLIEHPPEDTSQLLPKIRLIVEAAKKGIEQKVKEEIFAGIDDVIASHEATSAPMDELRELWRTWLPDHRILCLTESPSHVAMWHHYADQYRGVVLEFKCIDELDSAWLAAKPVTYPKEKPPIYTADGWAELMTYVQEIAVEKMLHAATYIKSPDWSYESEWRIASFKRPTDTGDFTDYRFNRKEMSAIYYGPMIDSDDRLSLRIAAGAFPDASLWDVEIGMSREFYFRRADA